LTKQKKYYILNNRQNDLYYLNHIFVNRFGHTTITCKRLRTHYHISVFTIAVFCCLKTQRSVAGHNCNTTRKKYNYNSFIVKCKKVFIIFRIDRTLLFLHFNQYSNFPYYISEKLNRFKEQVVQTVEKRNEYLKKLAEKLADYDLKIAEIKFKVAEVQDDMKAEYLSQIENLEEKRDELAVTYGQLKQSTGNAWTDIKTGTEKAWLNLEKAIEKAITRFK